MENGERRPPVGWQYAVFREWHRRVHPRTSYRVKPHVWTPEGLKRAEGKSEAERVQWKNCEPTLTGIVFTDRHVYLVLALTELDAASVGRMLYLSYLWRRDPDYAPHHAKHLHCVILSRDGARSVIEFARRRQIRVIPCAFDAIVTGTVR
jgi:hypothetical protein